MTSVSLLLPYIQVALSVLLIAVVLLQQGDPDLGGAFGGGDSAGGSYHTRRGFEKLLFNATAVFGFLFIVASVMSLLV